MCERQAALAVDAAPRGGSRRRRLWEMPSACHCPLVGVCLPVDVLRRLLAKALGGEVQADDHSVHVGAVAECGQRNRLSEQLQRELDRRCALALKRFAAAKHADAVAALWREAVEAGDIADALWATLSHARCDDALQQAVLREVHMIQHQAGAARRADSKRSERLASDNLRLGQELERTQQRLQQLQAERQADNEHLGAQLVRARADLIARDSLVASLRADLGHWEQQAPDLPARRELAQRLEDLLERNRQLQARLNRLDDTPRAEAPRVAEAPPPPEPPVPVAAPDLAARNVLCVGGRNGNVTQYRALVERCGGRFLHHDGGVEDNPHRLDASLAAADLVICQAGCLSHNAYWRVKDHCKRHGKRCVYLDKPGVAMFERGLAQGAAATPETPA